MIGKTCTAYLNHFDFNDFICCKKYSLMSFGTSYFAAGNYGFALFDLFKKVFVVFEFW